MMSKLGTFVKNLASRSFSTYSQSEKILIVGESNFKVSCYISSLMKNAKNLKIANELTRAVYGERYNTGHELRSCQNRCAEVLFKTDLELLSTQLVKEQFNKVVILDPRQPDGIYNKEGTEIYNSVVKSELTKDLLLAKELVYAGGEVHVLTPKSENVYKSWDIRGLAETAGYVSVDEGAPILFEMKEEIKNGRVITKNLHLFRYILNK